MHEGLLCIASNYVNPVSCPLSISLTLFLNYLDLVWLQKKVVFLSPTWNKLLDLSLKCFFSRLHACQGFVFNSLSSQMSYFETSLPSILTKHCDQLRCSYMSSFSLSRGRYEAFTHIFKYDFTNLKLNSHTKFIDPWILVSQVCRMISQTSLSYSHSGMENKR